MPNLRRQDHEGPRDPQHAQHQGRPGGTFGDQGAAQFLHAESGIKFDYAATR